MEGSRTPYPPSPLPAPRPPGDPLLHRPRSHTGVAQLSLYSISFCLSCLVSTLAAHLFDFPALYRFSLRGRRSREPHRARATHNWWSAHVRQGSLRFPFEIYIQGGRVSSLGREGGRKKKGRKKNPEKKKTGWLSTVTGGKEGFSRSPRASERASLPLWQQSL